MQPQYQYPPQQPQYPPAPQQPQYPPQQPQYPPQQTYPPAPQYGAPPQYQQQQPPAAQPVIPGTLDQFYSQPSTGGGKALTFEAPGTQYVGIVTRAIANGDVAQQTDTQGRPAFFRDGRPKFVMKIPLQMQPTPAYPDGLAQWYVKGAARDELVRAMAEAGSPEGPPEAGAVITITLTGTRPSGPGMNPTKLFHVAYRSPDSVVARPAPAAAPPAPVAAPPQQQYQPAPPPIYATNGNGNGAQPPAYVPPPAPVAAPPAPPPAPVAGPPAELSAEQQALLARLTGQPAQ